TPEVARVTATEMMRSVPLSVMTTPPPSVSPLIICSGPLFTSENCPPALVRGFTGAVVGVIHVEPPAPSATGTRPRGGGRYAPSTFFWKREYTCFVPGGTLIASGEPRGRYSWTQKMAHVCVAGCPARAGSLRGLLPGR